LDETGEQAEDAFARMETNLDDAGSDKPIWSASSETEMRGSDQKQIIYFCRCHGEVDGGPEIAAVKRMPGQ